MLWLFYLNHVLKILYMDSEQWKTCEIDHFQLTIVGLRVLLGEQWLTSLCWQTGQHPLPPVIVA